MKSHSKQISLVAHVTVRGLESLERGRIDLNDPRLDGELGTVQLELHADRATARQLRFEVNAARALFGDGGALQHLDECYIKPWRVKIAKVTSGDAEVDSYIQRTSAQLGHDLNVATPQN